MRQNNLKNKVIRRIYSAGNSSKKLTILRFKFLIISKAYCNLTRGTPFENSCISKACRGPYCAYKDEYFCFHEASTQEKTGICVTHCFFNPFFKVLIF